MSARNACGGQQDCRRMLPKRRLTLRDQEDQGVQLSRDRDGQLGYAHRNRRQRSCRLETLATILDCD